MRMSKNEIKVLDYVTSSGRALHPRDITKALGLSRGTISKIITSLEDKGLIEREDNKISLARTQHAERFKGLYYAHRASPFQSILADRRIDLLSKLDNAPKSVENLKEDTGILTKTIYSYLKGLRNLGIVKRTKSDKGYRYSFNYAFWGKLKDFVDSFTEFEEARLIPKEALLIKNYGDNVLFKSIAKLDATLTSFSAYEQYGIELVLRDYYYTLPKRELSIRDVFIHSLDSAESISHRLYCILFYLKYRNKLKKINHPMMKSIRAVLQGKRVKGYPSLDDVIDRMSLYDIKQI